MHVDEAVLSELKDFSGWATTMPVGDPLSLLDYVGFVATPDALCAFAELFFPELTVYGGRRFIASRFTVESYLEWKATGMDSQEIQKVMNHIHISTVLQSKQGISDLVALEAARIISDIWQRTIGSQGLSIEMSGIGYHDASVTFYDAWLSLPETETHAR